MLSMAATFYHNKMYFMALKEAKTKGSIVSTGKQRSYFSKGSVAIVASDDEGKIGHGVILEGRTIFAKFKPIEGIVGLTLQQAKDSFEAKGSVVQAIDFIIEKQDLVER